MAHMSPEDWANYENVINEFQADAFQQEIIWKRHLVTRGYNGDGSNLRSKDITIKGLIQYNYFRSWPITKAKDSGELDKESSLLFLNVKYLQDNGWANAQGHLKFDPGLDRFTINGLVYKPMGESQAAQAHNKPLFIFIVLKREEINTSENKYE